MIGGQTIKCPICGEPYVFYSMMAGDQSACGDCRDKARSTNGWPKPPIDKTLPWKSEKLDA